jgi:hypothetical protein
LAYPVAINLELGFETRNFPVSPSLEAAFFTRSSRPEKLLVIGAGLTTRKTLTQLSLVTAIIGGMVPPDFRPW